MATGTVFNLVNKKFETPTINSLAKIKHFIDNNEYRKSLNLNTDISIDEKETIECFHIIPASPMCDSCDNS